MSLRPAEERPPQGSTERLTAPPDRQRDVLDRAFDEFDIADLMESHSELVLNLTETIGHLEAALESRTIIGQALGVCIERYGITEQQAFQFLTRISQDQNIKLRDVARHLVETSPSQNGAAVDS